MNKIDLSYSFGGLFKKYKEYLLSDLWKEKRDIVIEEVGHCEICGEKKTYFEEKNVCSFYYRLYKESNLDLIPKECLELECKHKKFNIKEKKGVPLTVHHRSYFNVCNEDRDDLIVVCFECHKRIHNEPANIIHITK